MNVAQAAVKALILHPDGDKFLCIRHIINGQEIWEFPGGGIGSGETPYQALLREVREEVKLQVEIVKPLGIFWFNKIAAPEEMVLCTVFVCRPATLDADISLANTDEPGGNIVESRWVTKEQFLSDAYPVGNQSIKDLIKSM